MPSLRRTASSPSVRSTQRSSPYSSAALLTRAGHNNRRSSGSETSNRRVLADIDWWTVTDSQCSPDRESEASIQPIEDLFAQGLPITHVDSGLDYSLSWGTIPHILVGVNDETTEFTIPTEQFSSMSLTPQTPPRRFKELDSPSSSLESSPEPFLGPLPAGLSDFELGFAAAPLSRLPTQRRAPSRKIPSVITRSFTFADCFSLKADHPNTYADFSTSPLCSAPDFFN